MQYQFLKNKIMNSLKSFKCFIGLFFIINIPQFVSASDGKPVIHFTISTFISQRPQIDTVPSKVKSLDDADNKPVEEIIKAVPKARKQVVPIPVSLQIRPLIIIKPKIIKPIIKVLH